MGRKWEVCGEGVGSVWGVCGVGVWSVWGGSVECGGRE